MDFKLASTKWQNDNNNNNDNSDTQIILYLTKAQTKFLINLLLYEKDFYIKNKAFSDEFRKSRIEIIDALLEKIESQMLIK